MRSFYSFGGRALRFAAISWKAECAQDVRALLRVFGAAPKTLEPIVVIAFDSVRAGTLLAALAKLTRRRNRSQNKVLLIYLIFSPF
jgi:hypothetical protein